ncbi:aldehyde dehydrogenase family protein [Mariprofundus sp. EBB-1]|uniref:aldehyde dehydrogenase family protein n=1 Tax=Mariprofundus sp. EBB-1 TaxID=2650971 RepID=UPI000EF1F4A4|nr:aldehyde dehydrogenase family protein [Mariprofundus sp. EBB-1]RLL53545.1 aldehyde dehydrogenase family protein [Mariprofundus sp. EBB-1]
MNDHVEHYPLMISGASAENETSIEVRSPYDDRLLATVATADKAVVEAALNKAHTLFANRKGWIPVAERIAILERAIELMKERAEELARGAAEEGGKPLIDSRIEMVRCIDSIRICTDSLRTDSSHAPVLGLNTASRHRMALMQKEPIGVVVAVSAFNHPLNLIAHQIGPAIASGCPVIIKPAEDTPLSCYRLVRLFHQAGLPEDWCQFIMPTSTSLAEALVTDSRVAFFSFIGSANVGWYLRSKLAAGTRCALEHGGVAPVIIAADADINQHLPGLMKGAFYHAGQVCVSVQRIFAHASIARELADKMANLAKKMAVGDPLSEQTEVGPLIRAKELDRIDLWVKEAIAGGAKLLCGGDRLDHHCYAPTVLYNPPYDATISTREVFGPVVAVYPFVELDSAIDDANALDVAFQASVYSRDIDTALYISNRLDASAVMVNDHTAFRVDWMPFAGLKHSGLGVGGIPHTMHDMQIEKMTIIHSESIE